MPVSLVLLPMAGVCTKVMLIPSDFYLGDNTLLVSPGESESNTAVSQCLLYVVTGGDGIVELLFI